MGRQLGDIGEDADVTELRSGHPEFGQRDFQVGEGWEGDGVVFAAVGAKDKGAGGEGVVFGGAGFGIDDPIVSDAVVLIEFEFIFAVVIDIAGT